MRTLLLLGLILVFPMAARAEPLVVFAASSLKASLDRAAHEFQANGGESIVISYASSPALARQIDEGAPADLVLLAAPEWMDYLQERERIVLDSRMDLWGNSLSLIAHDLNAEEVVLDGSADLGVRLGSGHLAMALVDSVPVGRYGKQALQHIRQWDRVAPLVVQVQDARAAVAMVATGQAEYGLVYTTDAIALEAAGEGLELGRFAPGSHDPIVYPGAVVMGAAQAADAQAFLDFLAGPEGSAAFVGLGYEILTR